MENSVVQITSRDEANAALESLKTRIGELQRALGTKSWHWNEIAVLHWFIDSLGEDPACKRAAAVREMVAEVEALHLATKATCDVAGYPEPLAYVRLAELASTIRFAGGPVA